MEKEIDAARVGQLAAMCAAENARQRNWLYKFSFMVRWVNISRRPWAGADLEYQDVIPKDTRATAEDLAQAIETLKKCFAEDGGETGDNH